MRPQIEPGRLLSHRMRNFLQTVILVGAMGLLFVLIGYFFAGLGGLLWALLLGLVLLGLSLRLTPLLILTLYRARPLTTAEAPDLYRLIFELARRAELPALPRLYYVPSSTWNAFAVGSPERAYIGLTDGLMRRLDGRELAGVLAHEVSHIINNDIRVMGIADMLTRMTSLFSTFGQILLLINLPLILIDAVTIPWLAILILIAAPAVNGLLQLALSRTREFDADMGAAHLTGDPEGLARALEKMEAKHPGTLMRILFPGRGDTDPSLLRTHPSTHERTHRLRSLIKTSEPALSLRLYQWPCAPPHIERVTRRPRRHIWGLWH